MDLSEKLKAARTRLSLTLENVSERSGIAVSALSEFENAKREPKVAQLKKLADVYRRSGGFFLDESPFPTQCVLWRERPNSPYAEDLQATLVDLAEKFHNLEILGEQHFPMELPTVAGSSQNFRYPQAGALARKVRSELGLGDRPGQTLLRVLEEVCNAKVFHIAFEPTGSAACSMSDEFGAAILLNANSVRWRRNFDLAHELFHLLTWKIFRHDAEENSEVASDDEEKLATCFARNLLMPEEVFREAIDAQRGSSKSVGVDGLFEVAREFDVSAEAVLWQASFVFGLPGDKVKEVTEIIRPQVNQWETRESDQPPTRPVRYVALCKQALRKGLISTGRYAEYLGISRREAMRYVEQDAAADVEVELTHS